MRSMSQFANFFGFSMSVARVAPADGMPRTWACVLSRGGRSMTVFFSQGDAHNAPPSIEVVMSHLAASAEGWEESCHNLNEWSRRNGFPYSGSPAAVDAFDKVATYADGLRTLAGMEYGDLLYKTIRQYTEE